HRRCHRHRRHRRRRCQAAETRPAGIRRAALRPLPSRPRSGSGRARAGARRHARPGPDARRQPPAHRRRHLAGRTRVAARLDRRSAALQTRCSDALVRARRTGNAGRAGGLAGATEMSRPPGELSELERVWRRPTGLRTLTVVNNTHIGLLYIGTSMLFFVLAGLLALLMRAQLAVPDNTLVDAPLYNQLFTMHGTVMMFLFAVPVVEAIAVFLLPGMLGARDLPFPRLSAYAYWAYAIGGLAFFATIFFGASPDGGWFMYPPLTSKEYSPGVNADFWLLGIGFIEISAIAGAIELIIGILFTRAPGMTLRRMPIYVRSMLVVALMIVFAFPAIIAGTILLELERAFDWPFFIAARGGDPVLWQHLFWFFGHPEVYIIFLPAAGMVSTMIPTIAQTRLVGYRTIIVALIGVGILSF